jgi:hypothetical protein
MAIKHRFSGTLTDIGVAASAVVSVAACSSSPTSATGAPGPVTASPKSSTMVVQCAWWLSSSAVSETGSALETVYGPQNVNMPEPDCNEVQLSMSVSQDTGDSPAQLSSASLKAQGYTLVCYGTVSGFPFDVWQMPDAGDPQAGQKQCSEISS